MTTVEDPTHGRGASGALLGPGTGVQPSAGGSDESVVVCVHVRPLIEKELIDGCRVCMSVVPDEPQASASEAGSQPCRAKPSNHCFVPFYVTLALINTMYLDRSLQILSGPHCFTYDNVFGEGGEDPGSIFDRCVAPLVDGLFRGYNATVFAYGQTGSGKTHTMGSSFGGAGAGDRSVIPCVMAAIFGRVAAARDAEFTVRVGFVEIHKDDIRDLLVAENGGMRTVVKIKEVPGGGIMLSGAVEREVASAEEMIAALKSGAMMRATAETGMNKQSSRSHAIFTITLEQRKVAQARRGGDDGSDSEGEGEEGREEEGVEDPDAYLCAKMHLVDLAGSERVKRTKAQGARLREGIDINKGLLALGNVINALSEGKSHIPYRDSKLTRMLQVSTLVFSLSSASHCTNPFKAVLGWGPLISTRCISMLLRLVPGSQRLNSLLLPSSSFFKQCTGLPGW
jgi:hypothetical protein